MQAEKIFYANGVLMFLSGIQMLFYPDLYFRLDMSHVDEFRVWNHMLAVQIFTYSFVCFAVAQSPTKRSLRASFGIWFMWLAYHVASMMYSDSFTTMGFDTNAFIAWPALSIVFMIAIWRAYPQAAQFKNEKPLEEKTSLYVALIVLMVINIATIFAQPRVALRVYFPGKAFSGAGREFMENFMVCIGMFCICHIPVYAELANNSTPFQDLMIGIEWTFWAFMFAYMLMVDVVYYKSIGVDTNSFTMWLFSSVAISGCCYFFAITGYQKKSN